jgi:hypothetical protein
MYNFKDPNNVEHIITCTSNLSIDYRTHFHGLDYTWLYLGSRADSLYWNRLCKHDVDRAVD